MKTQICILLAFLILFSKSLPVLAQTPENLSIIQTGNTYLLHWPTNATSFSYVLQSSTNLALKNWVITTGFSGATYGSDVAITVSNTYAPTFFRLISLATTTSDGMALIPMGSFTIGDTLDGENDAIPTNVYLSAFYMDTNLISFGQWSAIYSYATNHGYNFANPGAGKAANHPVQTVDWYDSMKWCNARSELYGLTPVYYNDAAFTHVYTNGDNGTIVYANWDADGYRLPTEAEWEKAARGGANGQRFPWGNTISWNQANYYGDPLSVDPNGYAYDLATSVDYDPQFDDGEYPYTSPTGSFEANAYGLYDITGNLIEWCWDWYAPPPYPTGSPYLGGTNPRGPVSSPYNSPVMRGGDWSDRAPLATCAFRNYIPPTYAYYYYGFRCVRQP